MSHWKNVEVWVHGLFAAAIGGGASGVTAGLTAIGLSPDQFNFAGQLKHTMALVGTVFVINGLISVFLYLKQSPLPPLVDDTPVNQPQPPAINPEVK